jgi:hypothetical protein
MSLRHSAILDLTSKCMYISAFTTRKKNSNVAWTLAMENVGKKDTNSHV